MSEYQSVYQLSSMEKLEFTYILSSMLLSYDTEMQVEEHL